MKTTQQILNDAKEAKKSIGLSSEALRNSALLAMADAIESASDNILAANKCDLQSAKGNIGSVMQDRLRLTPQRIADIAEGVRQVAKLPNPLGELERKTSQNGLIISKCSVPMGVIGMIYESRPNVTADAAALSLKAGSCCVLRCGKEAWRSSFEIVKAIQNALAQEGVDPNAVSLIEDTTRQSALELMTAVGYIDLLIPRGGHSLISTCMEHATVPCIETGTGICHLFIDRYANLEKAIDLVENSKADRPSVCNSCEVCLVDKSIATQFLPKLKTRLVDEQIAKGLPPIELRLCVNSAKIINGTAATEHDFDTEFLDYILAVKIVDDVSHAIEHISKHSTAHSDCIVTENAEHAQLFTSSVDSAVVYVNASTRFTDGSQFGLGCEIGISTQKLHARGPMGLSEMCTYKYIVLGDGQIR